MNVAELARILKITPQELLQKLPQMGFDIGQKAIKIDNKIAQKIIKDWSFLNKKLEQEQKKYNNNENENNTKKESTKKEIFVPSFITVREFADLIDLPVSKVLAELMKNSIFASINEKIDFETASIIGSDLDLEIKILENKENLNNSPEENKLKKILELETKENLKPRPPVIVVMGHVDHGKTKLLDTIRNTNVVAGEAGGITQHIGAYQITRKNRTITFIDTPGHEAFTAMRSRGAKVADIAILVIAADDGVMPQTIEAYSIIKTANIPFIVAINKIDKPEANIEKTKQELSSQLNIILEDWGGKTICIPVSAKNSIGIDELLDTVLLVTDIESENLKANPDAPALGTVIESRISKGEGPVATMLIQNGTLRIGDQLVYNGMIYGKVRSLKNYKGENIEIATPAMPTKIIGLKISPAIGDILEVGSGEKIKPKKYIKENKITTTEKEEDINIKKINVIIKADVLGSIEAIEESLIKIETKEIKIKIIHRGLGSITEGDITRAATSNTKIIAFNVKTSSLIEEIARSQNVIIKKYRIIYDIINDLKKEMQELIEPEIVRINIGKIKTLAIFRTENKSQIIGGKVIEGRVESNTIIEVFRDEKLLTQGKIIRLQSGKQDVSLVDTGQECGMLYEGNPIIQINDILQIYKEEKITKKI